MSQPVPSRMMALHHNAYLQKSLKRSMSGIDGMICLNFKSTFVKDTYQETTPSSGERSPVAIILAINGIDKNSSSAIWHVLVEWTACQLRVFVLVDVASYWTIIGVRFGLYVAWQLCVNDNECSDYFMPAHGECVCLYIGKADRVIVVTAEHAGNTTSVTVNLVFPFQSVH